MGKTAIALLIAASGVACQGSASSSSSPAAGDSFARGGGPAPQTVTVTAQDGRTYTGTAGMTAASDPARSPLVLLTITAGDGQGHQWGAQLSLPVDAFASGDVDLTLKPWSQTPGYGFIDDQASPPVFSQSGTMHLQFTAGGHFTATVNADTPGFSGTVAGTYGFECFVPATSSGTSSNADPGTPTGGGTPMAQDTKLTSPFCSRFAWLE